MTLDPAAAIALMAALLALVGGLIGNLWLRISRLESENKKATAYNRALWEWARRHLDLYFRHRKDGSPDPEPIPDPVE